MEIKNEIIIIQGSIANIRVLQLDPLATAVTLYVRNDTTLTTFSVTASYSSGVADLFIAASNTQVAGIYSYQINEQIPEGIVKYGAFDPNEDGEPIYGKIVIAETIDGTIS